MAFQFIPESEYQLGVDQKYKPVILKSGSSHKTYYVSCDEIEFVLAASLSGSRTFPDYALRKVSKAKNKPGVVATDVKDTKTLEQLSDRILDINNGLLVSLTRFF